MLGVSLRLHYYLFYWDFEYLSEFRKATTFRKVVFRCSWIRPVKKRKIINETKNSFFMETSEWGKTYFTIKICTQKKIEKIVVSHPNRDWEQNYRHFLKMDVFSTVILFQYLCYLLCLCLHRKEGTNMTN